MQARMFDQSMVETKQEIMNTSVDPDHTSQHHNELAYLRSKVADLSSLIEVSIIINSILDVDELVGLVMEKAQSVMKAEASSVLLVNEETNMLECEVALGEVGDQVKKIQLKMGEGIAGWVAQHGEAEIIPDVAADPRFASKIDDSTGFQTRSILAAPLSVKNKVIGVAEVINRVDGKAFDEEDLELFSTFCRQVAMAIENARMYKLKLEKQKLEQQLEHARTIQQSFMPQVFPSSPDQKFSVYGQSLAAASVGGDLFDLIEFGKDEIGVALGDVTGKGVPAALYMARLVSDFRLNSQLHHDPADVLRALNNLLVDRSRRGMFVTFQYGILDHKKGTFTFANAGHLPFIHVQCGRKTVALLEGGKGIPLGIAPAAEISTEMVQLDHGDHIVFVTDGIIEAKNEAGELYSLERTVELVNQSYDSAEQVVENLLQDVQQFAGNADQHDDVTIVALKWN